MVLLPADETQQTATETGIADNDTAPPQQALADVSLSEAVLSQASDDFFSSSNFSSEARAREETGSTQPLAGDLPPEPPAQFVSTEPVPNPQPSAQQSPQPSPQEDFAYLFEPHPVPTPPVD